MKRQEALLVCQNVTKDFGGLVAVKDLSFEVNRGELLGIIGPNGAGKTTVFNLITGLVPPTSGVIEFKGEDVVGLKPHDICMRGISRTFQLVRTFLNLSVYDNIILGALFGRGDRGRNFEDRVLEVLDLTELSTRKDVITKNMNTQERKRVEIGRALATNPELLLLDEPMAGLNRTEVKQLSELIRRISEKGVTLIVVEHVMKAIMNLANRVVVLHHGEKLAEGSPREMTRTKSVIEVYLGDTYVPT